MCDAFEMQVLSENSRGSDSLKVPKQGYHDGVLSGAWNGQAIPPYECRKVTKHIFR